ncbi:hypothetical protein HaloA020_36680 (plasmid) [Halomonas sp. A020]|uniref:hypothetical protein n=1 Tax=Halomonas sp. A020 TaxID=2717374 RepID=UPI002490AFDB|nr:hypothetical protein [Halomonas sp. A020]BCB62967.1 hypothetical protein HaloA020_36680 [Halomonas sp. A020]
MRTLGLVGLILGSLAIASAANGDDKERLISALEPWNPEEIILEGEQLIVITRERRMTDEVLRPLISTGICMPVFTGAPDSYLAGVEEIAVLNTFGRQGYIFSGGRSECEEIGNLPMSDTEMFILSRTRMHTNTN